MQWTSTNAVSCTATEGPADFSTGGSTGSADSSVTEPAPGTSQNFTVECANAGGVTSSDTIVITKSSLPPPTATLQVRLVGDVTWSTADQIIDYGQQIELQWTSTNAVSCTAIAGAGFSTGGSTGSIDSDITEPGSNSSDTYTVECSSLDHRWEC